MNLHTLVADLQRSFAWAPPWLFSLVLMALAVVLAVTLHSLVVRLVQRGLKKKEDAFWRPLLVRTRKPGRLAMVVVALGVAADLSPLTREQTSLVQHILLVLFIGLIGWAMLTATEIAAALYLRRYRVDVEDNLLARKHLTQVRILQQAVRVLIIILTTGLALMTIPQVRQWGVSLLAAGGAAGLIVGLALQPLLTNLIAGIQIAMTQPIRIDDAVIVESEWGRIEEINATYVVVKLWDERRMVLPLTYFLQNPFQNWTRNSAALTGAVMLYVDYTTPLEPVRQRLKELVENSPLWDRRTVVLQVTDARERTMELRILVSAADSGRLFDLRCEVREKLIAFLRDNFQGALPRDRLELAALEGWTSRDEDDEPRRSLPQ
ncbi:mechanosensitive ion channel family protein [Phenylobacterium deserti]|uniref:Mechanosensitive ion channel family protein n=1 Tax=Phenylobacterium deserti TaxID=1914756 RepID=A0A328AN75_9CAUL|nr:mechanosensitive ion channel family protein [Phenylobacterium deserti]RAK56452.1 mechanosensitive ion channel family protein [Phenylobacterium deserti]